MAAIQNLFNLGTSNKIEINFDNESKKKSSTVVLADGTTQTLPIFYDGENVTGYVSIHIRKGSKLEHQGIRIEFVGLLEFCGDRNARDEFVSLRQDLARPGILQEDVKYPFEFCKVDKPFESFNGSIVKVKYFVRVTAIKRLTNITKSKDLLVNTLALYSDVDSSIKMEVGIEESLHIEFEYNKSRYHLNDVIIGKIYFILVRVKIKNMELQIVRKETTGYGVNSYTDSETVARFEIMDGAPTRGESIPIRLFLGQYQLCPTITDPLRRFSVRYLLNLVLLDEEDRRYYKHQEILLYRKAERRVKQYANLAKIPGITLTAAGAIRKSSTGDDGSEDENSVLSHDSLNRAARSMHRFEPKQLPEGFKENGNLNHNINNNNNIDQDKDDDTVEENGAPHSVDSKEGPDTVNGGDPETEGKKKCSSAKSSSSNESQEKDVFEDCLREK